MLQFLIWNLSLINKLFKSIKITFGIFNYLKVASISLDKYSTVVNKQQLPTFKSHNQHLYFFQYLPIYYLYLRYKNNSNNKDWYSSTVRSNYNIQIERVGRNNKTVYVLHVPTGKVCDGQRTEPSVERVICV